MLKIMFGIFCRSHVTVYDWCFGDTVSLWGVSPAQRHPCCEGCRQRAQLRSAHWYSAVLPCHLRAGSSTYERRLWRSEVKVQQSGYKQVCTIKYNYYYY